MTDREPAPLGSSSSQALTGSASLALAAALAGYKESEVCSLCNCNRSDLNAPGVKRLKKSASAFPHIGEGNDIQANCNVD